jgi:hypothetical protein
MNHSDLTSFPADPKYVGPGVWFMIHSVAYRALNEKEKEGFRRIMVLLSETFPCSVCRNHIQEYIKQHPIEQYWNIIDVSGRPIGMFKWSVDFHNTVNKRLEKPIIPLNDAMILYQTPEQNPDDQFVPCQAGCNGDINHSDVVIPPVTKNVSSYPISSVKRSSPIRGASISRNKFQGSIIYRP